MTQSLQLYFNDKPGMHDYTEINLICKEEIKMGVFLRLNISPQKTAEAGKRPAFMYNVTEGGKRELDLATRTLPTFWLDDRIHQKTARLDENESEKRVPMTVCELIRRGLEEAAAHKKGALDIEEPEEER